MPGRLSWTIVLAVAATVAAACPALAESSDSPDAFQDGLVASYQQTTTTRPLVTSPASVVPETIVAADGTTDPVGGVFSVAEAVAATPGAFGIQPLALTSPNFAFIANPVPSTSGATCSGGGSGDGDCRNSVRLLINTQTTVQSRYAWNINADTTVFSTHDTSGNARHNLTFDATASGGYRLDISTTRVGAMGRSGDAPGCDGAADTSGITGNSNIGLSSGTLSLADPGGIGNGGGDANSPYNQSSGTATIFRVSNGVTQSHSLSFTWSGSVRSNSCEASVRQGESSGTTSGCDVCGYPGNPSRTQSSDGHFVTVSITSMCGNGVVDAVVSEQCDQGAANGTPGSCCTGGCRFVTSGTVCRSAVDECDQQETCSGVSGTCPADAKKPNGTACTSDGKACTLDQCNGSSNACQHPAGHAGSQCRASGGPCDPAENCDGSNINCPADAKSPSGTVCRASAGVCDPAETCNGTSNGCPADAKSTAVCRAAAGICDVAESCDGVNNDCPTDAFASNSTVCRAASGACDVADFCSGTANTCNPDSVAGAFVQCRGPADACDQPENCDGVNKTCPPDVFRPSTFTCRASAGVCDVAEHCTGTTIACPADAKSTAQCRAAAGVCDVAETCDGVGNNCPANAFQSSSTVCRGAAGVCDLAENCTGSTANCPADAKSTAVCRASAGACDVAESCNGVSNNCPADAFASSSVVCRGSAGACDVAETCTGSGADCPADSVAGAFVVCRGAAGGCDLPETCNGVTTNCPPDLLAPIGTTCRAAVGSCDVAEQCSGTSAACPADAFQSSSTVCRPAAGVCDVAENCTGSTGTCPADAAANTSTQCRASAGFCDVAENCDGVNPACPADAFKPSSVQCRASGGVCDQAESCTGTSAACPADAKSTAVCRAAAGVCDLAESCDGINNNCPADTLKAVGTTCRAAAGVCDVAEVCTGTSSTCPADLTLPDGTSCSDGSACTGPDTCQSGVCTGSANPDVCADDFLCYKVKPTTPFSRVSGVTLHDEFEDVVADVLKIKNLCTPTDKNGGGVIDNSTHEEAYQIKTSPRHVRRTHIHVQNQLGTLFIDTVKPDLLLVPTGKNLSGPAVAPAPNNVNHYKCYKMKVSSGTPGFPRGIRVTVADQFTSPPKFIDLRKVRHFCTPVSKNSEPIPTPDAHLMCYQAKTSSGQPRHVRRTGVNTNNQFAPGTVSTIKENELCIPSLVIP